MQMDPHTAPAVVLKQSKGKEQSVYIEPNTDLNNEYERLLNEPITQPINEQEVTQLSYDQRIAQFIEESRVQLTDNIPKPPACLSFFAGNDKRIVGTLGNFIVVSGKAKSGKTYLTSCIAASWLADNFIIDTILGELPEGRKVLLYIDTEQGKYHVHVVMKRIQALTGLAELPTLLVFSLRPYATKERLDIIRKLIYSTDGLGAVIIDGIRDTVFSINDEIEATERTTDLLQWTQQQDICLVTIIHENKGDRNLRGHLGAELTNRAETVISVTKNKAECMSEVNPEYCRNRDFEPFSFTITENGMPCLADNMPVRNGPNGKPKPEPITPDNITAILARGFLVESTLGYSKLRTNIMEGSSFIGKKLGKSAAEEFISRALNDGSIEKILPEKGYPFYQLTPPSELP